MNVAGAVRVPEPHLVPSSRDRLQARCHVDAEPRPTEVARGGAAELAHVVAITGAARTRTRRDRHQGDLRAAGVEHQPRDRYGEQSTEP